ncbi:MAG: Antitoxin component of bacterial toxin-antitoxin system, MqsA [Thermomicrobiales bacterium]|jgi:YgiT-type zinc finger domain-containing protein|nr:Antitoxin component of bacterial toxin-antitoxin system, MqsA [Thermomicrobiales bacterium]MEA2596640.1 Antitoxin component of bacterial toxin-antitoxin system, MqsA [Thermomicrobiales bacterium]
MDAATPEDLMKTCVQCRGRVHVTTGELKYQHDDFVVTVTDVPMLVCERCGEQYVHGPLGVELGSLVDALIRQVEATANANQTIAYPRSLVLQASDRARLALAS